MNVLNSLDFSLDTPMDSVIESRTEVMIDSSAPLHTPTSNNIIRLYMNGNGFVDPHSIAVYATVTYRSLQAEANVIPPTMYDVVNTIRVIDGSGQVLEEINEAELLNQKLHEASSNSDYLDCSGGFSNSQKDPSKRPLLNATPYSYRVNATDCLGLFQQEKYLHLPSFKGLQLELRLNSNDRAFTKKVADTCTYELSNVKLVYDEIQVSRGYMDLYSQQVSSGGYAISFSTYTHLQNSVGVGTNQVALNKTASKVKAFLSCLRESGNVDNAISKSTATDSRVVSYQYQVNGKNYPGQPIESPARAFQELLVANYNHKDNRHANICVDDFTSEYAFAGSKSDADVQKGTFVMWKDTEKASGSALSGIESSANSTFLRINVATGPVAPIVDTFVNHERVLSVQSGRVIVID